MSVLSFYFISLHTYVNVNIVKFSKMEHLSITESCNKKKKKTFDIISTKDGNLSIKLISGVHGDFVFKLLL